MRNIKFKSGYYEWLIYVEDTFCWAIGSGITDLFFQDDTEDEDEIEKNINYAVESEIDIMLMTAENDKEIDFDYNKELILSLTEEELEELKNIMINVFKKVYL